MTTYAIRFGIHATVSALLLTSANAQSTIGAEGRNGYIDLPNAFAPSENEIRFSNFLSNQETKGRRIDFQATSRFGIGMQVSDQFDTDANIVEDASIDFRLNVFDESQYIPAIALGIDDVLGDGARAGEYIVASKSFGNFDASVGIGWGNYSSETRAFDPVTVSGDNLFGGAATPFIGAAYHTPIDGLSLAAEYSETTTGDDYRFGLGYQGRFFNAGAYYQGEDKFSVGLTLFANPYSPLAKQNQYGAPVTVVPRARLGLDSSTDWYAAGAPIGRAIGEALAPTLEEEGFTVHAIKIDANAVAVEVAGSTHIQTPLIFGRISRLLAKSAPASIETFTFITVNEHGIPVSEVVVSRDQFEALQDHEDRVRASFETATIQGAKRLSGDNVYRPDSNFDFDYGFGLGVEGFDNVDGENQIVLNPNVKASVKLFGGLSLNARASTYLNRPESRLDVANSINVSRDDKLLFIDDAVVVDRLTLDYHTKLGRDFYGRLSAGYLETQYAGVNVEALYAPAGLPFAFGVTASEVQKRNPESQFALLDRSLQTHQATVYWDTGYKGIEVSAGYGKYLDGDDGTSLGMRRKFANGWAVDAGLVVGENYATSQSRNDIKTSLQFSVPLQWAIPTTRTRVFDFDLKNASNSGFGNALNIANPLYGDVSNYDKTDYKLRWSAFWQ